jgi:hypothetical protein
VLDRLGGVRIDRDRVRRGLPETDSVCCGQPSSLSDVCERSTLTSRVVCTDTPGWSGGMHAVVLVSE